VCLASGGQDLEELAGRIEKLVRPELPTTLIEKLKKLPELARTAEQHDAQASAAASARRWWRQTILTWRACRYPVLARATRGLHYVRIDTDEGPGDGRAEPRALSNPGDGPRKAAMHWQVHHDGARHWRGWAARGKHHPPVAGDLRRRPGDCVCGVGAACCPGSAR